MQNKYEIKVRLRTSDFDTCGNIKPSSVLDLFQEAAGAHAVELGCGFDDLVKKELLWVVTKVKYKVLKDVPMHCSVTVCTWPSKPSRVAFEREYKILDENGDTLIIGTSQWTIMHKEKRTLVLVNDIYPLSDFCEDKNFDEKLAKVPDFETADFEREILPVYSELDRNGHVNNIRYADYVLNCIEPKDKKICDFQIDFHREIKKDVPVLVSAKQNDSVYLAKGTSNDGEKMFSAFIGVK